MTSICVDHGTGGKGRPLCCRYLFLRFVGVSLPVSVDGGLQPLAAHWVIGVLRDGQTDIIGGWTGDACGVVSWSLVFDELAARGVERVHCVDGLDDAAIQAVWPGAQPLPSGESFNVNERRAIRALERQTRVVDAHLSRALARLRPFSDRQAAEIGLTSALAGAERRLSASTSLAAPRTGSRRVALAR